MNEIERILATEEIKRVKAKYFYGLDHKDWELWRREVWAPEGWRIASSRLTRLRVELSRTF